MKPREEKKGQNKERFLLKPFELNYKNFRYFYSDSTDFYFFVISESRPRGS